MISRVSFGSSYKVTTNYNEKRAFDKFQKFAITHSKGNDVSINFYDYQSAENPLKMVENIVLTVPDTIDNEVELFCNRKGISYKKYHDCLPELVDDDDD